MITGIIVSFDDEPLILVDTADQEIGFLDKASVHDGPGLLHRAFSLFVFNSKGELLLQQRASRKRLWPGFWSNTCCSHPRRGEAMEVATQRRLDEELGLQCALSYQFKFQYDAQFEDIGSERELCWVYTGVSDVLPTSNPTEIAAFRYVTPDALDQEIMATPEIFTPWFKIEWARLRNHPSAEFRSHFSLCERAGGF